MAEESGQERTEEPTAKRLNDARQKGQIARSRELNTMGVLLVGSGGLLLMGETMIREIADSMTRGLSLERKHGFDLVAMVNLLQEQIASALLTLLPLFVLLTAIAFLAPMALGGWSFSVQAMAFKWSKMNPIKGLGRIFAWRGVVELLKAMGKFLIIGSAVVLFIWIHGADFLALGAMDIEPALAGAANLLGWAFLNISLALIVLALIDVPFQIWDHQRQLKMTRQEIKDEYKETEGHPEVRAKIRNTQREMAQRRMMQEVPKADVVVTNPTHYAVALRYDQAGMGAPRVVAKGSDLVAAEIRRIAQTSNVPLASAPPLARALFFSTELNHEIPAGLYHAVAQVLAYVFQLKRKPGPKPKDPIEMIDLPIPEDLRHD